MKAPATLDEFYRTFPNGLRARGLWQCAGCRCQASLTAGTPFHGTRVPLRTWFLAMFFVARHKQGISALQFQRDAGLGTYKTAWMLLHKVRSTLAQNSLFPLEGDVEADETYVGGYRPGRNGRGVGKTGVAIRPEETTVFTDAWGYYAALGKLGIDHRPRNSLGQRAPGWARKGPDSRPVGEIPEPGLVLPSVRLVATAGGSALAKSPGIPRPACTQPWGR